METIGTDGFLCCLLLFLCFLGTSCGVVSLGTKDWAGESCFSKGRWSLGLMRCSGLVGGLESHLSSQEVILGVDRTADLLALFFLLAKLALSEKVGSVRLDTVMFEVPLCVPMVGITSLESLSATGVATRVPDLCLAETLFFLSLLLFDACS